MTRGLNVRDDTIAAIATPVSGTGGIGVLRVSGKRSEDICRRIFRPRRRGSRFESHRLYLGDIVGDDDSMVIDEVLVALMRAPHSYTGEDVLEISCHGNPLILKALLARVLKAGARVAEPGEFTRRAFLNGRIDLAQAEAVADLVSASSEQARRQALYALRGDLSRRIGVIRTLLLEVLAGLEASIDFTEEDISHPEGGQYDRLLEEAISAMRATVASYDRGTLYRRGLTAVITGRPNVGKSSLLNRLAGEERAIVTDQPGTTRDYIDVEVALQDMVVRFVDTAGIRLSDLEIEREGVRHARERAGEADLVIILLDGSEGLRDGDAAIAEENQGRSILPLVNKCDLPLRISADEVARLLPGAASPLFVSAKENRGINDLKERIIQEYRSEAGDPGDVVLTNLRHRDALKEALECAERARRALAAGASPELPAFDIGEALRRVAVITGETVTDEVLETIFSRFCVGK